MEVAASMLRRLCRRTFIGARAGSGGSHRTAGSAQPQPAAVPLFSHRCDDTLTTAVPGRDVRLRQGRAENHPEIVEYIAKSTAEPFPYKDASQMLYDLRQRGQPGGQYGIIFQEKEPVSQSYVSGKQYRSFWRNIPFAAAGMWKTICLS